MAAKLLRIAPVLMVRDIKASVEFWREKVGFETDQIYNGNFAMPTRDGITIMLAEAPRHRELPVPNWRVADKTNQVYMWVDDAAALYEEIKERGAPIDFTLYDTPWGTREFGIQDLDDHDIAFGQVL